LGAYYRIEAEVMKIDRPPPSSSSLSDAASGAKEPTRRLLIATSFTVLVSLAETSGMNFTGQLIGWKKTKIACKKRFAT
jgi:hypothetical protein